MPANDHNEAFDNLTVGDSIVDPAGVEHTSELADAADIANAEANLSLENTDGNTLLTTTTLQAGTDCEFVDDGDGTATLNVNVNVPEDTDTHIDVENQDGSPLVQNIDAIHAGSDLDFTDDGDGTVTLDFTGSTSSGSSHPAPAARTATASGDGTTNTFELSHSLGVTPSAVDVTPAAEDACSDFFISSTTSSVVRITYPRAPPSGTDNLAWHLIAHE